jgi:hypothetical protein
LLPTFVVGFGCAFCWNMNALCSSVSIYFDSNFLAWFSLLYLWLHWLK